MGKVQKTSDVVTSDYSDYLSKERLVTKVTSDYKPTRRNKLNYTDGLARSRAEYLAFKLNNPSRFMFYLKCAWNLTDAYLDRLLSISLLKKDPARYFSKAASIEMANNS